MWMWMWKFNGREHRQGSRRGRRGARDAGDGRDAAMPGVVAMAMATTWRRRSVRRVRATTHHADGFGADSPASATTTATVTALALLSAPTEPSWPSSQAPPTWWPARATPTAPTTCSSTSKRGSTRLSSIQRRRQNRHRRVPSLHRHLVHQLERGGSTVTSWVPQATFPCRVTTTATAKPDIAVLTRVPPSTGTSYISLSGGGTAVTPWGTSGDVPIEKPVGR